MLERGYRQFAFASLHNDIGMPGILDLVVMTDIVGSVSYIRRRMSNRVFKYYFILTILLSSFINNGIHENQKTLICLQ